MKCFLYCGMHCCSTQGEFESNSSAGVVVVPELGTVSDILVDFPSTGKRWLLIISSFLSVNLSKHSGYCEYVYSQP